MTATLLTGLFVGCTEPLAGDNDGQDHSPHFETYFTYPEDGEPDDDVEDQLVELVESTPDGATLRAAFYTFSRDRVAEAIGDAHNRGVDVRVVLGNTNIFDDGSSWDAVERLRAHLDDRLTICNEDEDDGGCMGENIQHNKFITISRLDDGTEDVVAQTSSNITEDARRDQFNNMVVAYNNSGLYRALTSYWEELQRDRTNLEIDNHREGDAETEAYFFPLPSGDPILDVLRDVECQTGGEVYLAVAFFTDSRSEIAARLSEMDDEGCDVHALITENDWVGSPGDQQIRPRLASGDIEFGVVSEDADTTLHSKYLAVEDFRDDQQSRTTVWTGSKNYTWSGLRNNDELVLEINDRTVFDDYRQDWKQIRPAAETVHP